MAVVRKTAGTSYVVAELDGSESQLRVAGFRLIPYFPRTSTLASIASDSPDEGDTTEDDPEDVQYLASLSPESRSYHFLSPPSF